MSVYERLKEESNDKKKAKARRSARTPSWALSAFEKGREAARRKRHSIWRYYRSKARNRRIEEKKVEVTLCPPDGEFGTTRS